MNSSVNVSGLPANPARSEPVNGLPQIPGYEVVSRIGYGGMGEILKARHTRLKRFVAIKLMRNERWHTAEALQRFQREMEAVGEFDHPGIVRAFDAGEIDGRQYLIMEYVQGFDWESLVHLCGPLPVTEACELIRQAAVALQYAHERGFVHRDVKPANAMLTLKGSVKILDLGLARLVENDRHDVTSISSGRLLGTLDYMAPEQAKSVQNVDRRADIYSLGATLYKLLTGVPPFFDQAAGGTLQKLTALATAPIPALTARCSPAPQLLEQIVTRMLAKKPDDRFDSMADIAVALEPLCARADLASVATHAAAAARDLARHAGSEQDCNSTWTEFHARPTSRDFEIEVAPNSQPSRRDPGAPRVRGGIVPAILILAVLTAAVSMTNSASPDKLADAGRHRPASVTVRAAQVPSRTAWSFELQDIKESRSRDTEWIDGAIYGQHGGLLRFLRGGTSWFEVDFDWTSQQIHAGRLVLVVAHHASRMGDVGSGFAPVAIILNGQPVWRGSPPDESGADIWRHLEQDVSRQVRPGRNVLRWELASGATTNYWLRSFAISLKP